MGRKKDPNTKYKMKAFISQGRRYAVTTNPGYNVNNKWCSNISIWGTLPEDLVFTPNIKFVNLSEEEKHKFIFPDTWDISKAFVGTGKEDDKTEVHQGEDSYKIYGDSMLLENTTESCGLKDDLIAVFGEETANKMLSIAYFWIETEKDLNRMESEAEVQWFPTEKGLSPSEITRLSQSVTKEQADRFMALRKQRYEKDCNWFGIDSTSISSYSEKLADVRWGKNKEHDTLRQLNLLVMYDMNSELPVHYRNLPGNIPDSRTLDILFEELKSSGFNNYGLVMDRAYLTKENLDRFIENRVKGIFMAKTSDKCIKQKILSSDMHREGKYLIQHDCYGLECIYPHSIKESEGPGRGTAVNQRLCLYFDPEIQACEYKEIERNVYEHEQCLIDFVNKEIPITEKALKDLSRYFDVSTENRYRILSYTAKSEVALSLKKKIEELIKKGTPVSGQQIEEFREIFDIETALDILVSGYAKNQDKVDSERETCGYFAIVCCNLPAEEHDISWVLSTYKMRDGQEKAFSYKKSSQNGRRLRTSTEASTDGRSFFQFVTLIVNCQLHHLYKKTSEDFRKKMYTPWNMLDKMRSVRLVKLKGRKPRVSEFVGSQIDIFDELGFEIPKGCRPKTKKAKSKNKKEAEL